MMAGRVQHGRCAAFELDPGRALRWCRRCPTADIEAREGFQTYGFIMARIWLTAEHLMEGGRMGMSTVQPDISDRRPADHGFFNVFAT